MQFNLRPYPFSFKWIKTISRPFLNMYSILQVLAIHMRIRHWPFIYILVLLSLLLSFPRAFVYALQIANTIRQIFETQHVTKYCYTSECNSLKSTEFHCYYWSICWLNISYICTRDAFPIHQRQMVYHTDSLFILSTFLYVSQSYIASFKNYNNV